MGEDTRVLAVASRGGHWVQLRRLRPAWEGCRVHYLTTDPAYRKEVEEESLATGQARPGFHVALEANRWQKFRLLISLLQIIVVLLRVRPHAVISTGAAPGYFAIRVGRLIGARTIWVDSIANGQELSLSGQRVGKHVDLWLTQWPHLAAEEGVSGPAFKGSVL